MSEGIERGSRGGLEGVRICPAGPAHDPAQPEGGNWRAALYSSPTGGGRPLLFRQHSWHGRGRA
eukprot:75187-Pyramimonas_sp.AAC.1